MSVRLHNKSVDFVCINVATNAPRRRHMEQCRDSLGIPMRFFAAITPETIDSVKSDYRKARTVRWLGRALIPTEIACALSHIQVWRDFLQSDDDYLMVFEDDVRFEADFMQVVSAVLAMPALPDFIKFSGQHERPNVRKRSIGFGDYALFLNAYGPIDAACYMLSKEGARRLEAYCSKMHLMVDVMMDRAYEHGALCYSVRPYPARPIVEEGGDFTSSIGMEGRKSKYDHSNVFLKLATRCLRIYTSVRKHWETVKLKAGLL